MWKSEWLYRKNGFAGDETIGPVSTKALIALCRDGTIARNTLVSSRQATEGQWVAASSRSLLSHEIEGGEEERSINASLVRDYRKDQVRWFARDHLSYFISAAVLVGLVVLLVFGGQRVLAARQAAKRLRETERRYQTNLDLYFGFTEDLQSRVTLLRAQQEVLHVEGVRIKRSDRANKDLVLVDLFDNAVAIAEKEVEIAADFRAAEILRQAQMVVLKEDWDNTRDAGSDMRSPDYLPVPKRETLTHTQLGTRDGFDSLAYLRQMAKALIAISRDYNSKIPTWKAEEAREWLEKYR